MAASCGAQLSLIMRTLIAAARRPSPQQPPKRRRRPGALQAMVMPPRARRIMPAAVTPPRVPRIMPAAVAKGVGGPFDEPLVALCYDVGRLRMRSLSECYHRSPLFGECP
mmetsp:Transcript_8019/g.16897  ORF Transcript_8019/g.16897 Transcript_8019/m.16897 type:complete len:110 (-) Transcript_8019:14-343(-)